MAYQKIALNGNWEFHPGLEKPTQFKHKVPVPALVDMAKPKMDWEKFDYFWYATDLKLPRGAKFERIFLQLEQVQFGTEVWLNDQKVGSDTPCYTSQEFDLTPYIKKRGKNRLLVRVGRKHTLPESSAVGQDAERLAWIPGIWGDAWLHIYGQARSKWTVIVPDVDSMRVEVKTHLQNFQRMPRSYKLHFEIWDDSSDIPLAVNEYMVSISEEAQATVETFLLMPRVTLWTPQNPYLYTLYVTILDGDVVTYEETFRFGMRTFELRDGQFYLNGERIVMMGSNIAFQRLLTDPDRGLLPWQEDWIRRVLVDISREYGLNCFRMHLGHAYNRWYDLADAHGVIIYDEWAFWNRTGSRAEVERELSAWIQENSYHPAILIWDPLNECDDPEITSEIAPKLKSLDPSRPWQHVDFNEDHASIFALGPVLNATYFGASRSISDMESSDLPIVIDEYPWWWLDRDNQPTRLTQQVLKRWVGPSPKSAEVQAQQSYLIRELTELWRRLDADIILPFLYLGEGSDQATGHWFEGDLADLKPKPVLSALKNAFSPVGVSLEMWDRHFLVGESREIFTYLFNDTPDEHEVTLHILFVINGAEREPQVIETHTLRPYEHMKTPITIGFPIESGPGYLIARISNSDGTIITESRKPFFVFEPNQVPDMPSICVHDTKGEIWRFFELYNISSRPFPHGLEESQVLLMNNSTPETFDAETVSRLTEFVKKGGVMIVQELEFNIDQEATISLLDDVAVHIEYRRDPDRGGYDSYVFATDANHRLWQGIEKDHLKMFNGGRGGEMVSQYNVEPSVPYQAAAHSHLDLLVPAIMEIPYGKGWLVISRIQVRGRLYMRRDAMVTRSRLNMEHALYERRYDPVAERYMINLITSYVDHTTYHKKVKSALKKVTFHIASVTSSAGLTTHIDGECVRVAQNHRLDDAQMLEIRFGEVYRLNKIMLSGLDPDLGAFEVHVSTDGDNWDSRLEDDGVVDGEISVNMYGKNVQFIKVVCQASRPEARSSLWGIHFNVRN